MAPAHISAFEGKTELVVKCLDRNFDINEKEAKGGDTLLHKACKGSHSELVRILLDRRCHVNVRNSDGRRVDSSR